MWTLSVSKAKFITQKPAVASGGEFQDRKTQENGGVASSKHNFDRKKKTHVEQQLTTTVQNSNPFFYLLNRKL